MDFNCSIQRQGTSRNPTDEVLIQQLESGQSSALETIYQRYACLVHTLALQILKNEEEAEDITQEIFLVLYQQCRYGSDRSSLKSFLAMTTRSRATDRARSHEISHRAVRHLQLTTLFHTTVTPLETAAQNQSIQQVRHALSRLSRKEREVLESAYYRELSQSAISHQLGIPLQAVRLRTHEGIKKLRCVLYKRA